jgi:glycosyltransferase involved in cell wall biosynthesis
VILVGQTPPPVGGQAMVIENILAGSYENTTIHHVRLSFSASMSEIGRPSLSKVWHLVQVILRIAYLRARTGAETLYYPPANPDPFPMYRDFAILLATRWMFRTTIFHFHAGGISEVYSSLPRWQRPIFRRAYWGACVGIRTAELAPPDPRQLHAAHDRVVLNGIADVAAGVPVAVDRFTSAPTILYIGMLRRTKGVGELLKAIAILRGRQAPHFFVNLVGEFESAGYRREIEARIEADDLQTTVTVSGVLTGHEKAKAFAEASILCFPTYVRSETSGVVLVEAMQFGMPIVATEWSGVRSLVRDGENGLLVQPRDAEGLADALEKLLADPDLREELGANGRRMYEEDYRITTFHSRMQEVFDLAARSCA